MRKTLGLVAVAVLVVVGSACQPALKITATPSTKTPACKALTTVTGSVTPKGSLGRVTLETKRADGKWVTFSWFENVTDVKGPIEAKPSSTGAYKMTYLAPNTALPATISLRVQGSNASASAASPAWNVRRPSC